MKKLIFCIILVSLLFPTLGYGFDMKICTGIVYDFRKHKDQRPESPSAITAPSEELRSRIAQVFTQRCLLIGDRTETEDSIEIRESHWRGRKGGIELYNCGPHGIVEYWLHVPRNEHWTVRTYVKYDPKIGPFSPEAKDYANKWAFTKMEPMWEGNYLVGYHYNKARTTYGVGFSGMIEVEVPWVWSDTGKSFNIRGIAHLEINGSLYTTRTFTFHIVRPPVEDKPYSVPEIKIEGWAIPEISDYSVVVTDRLAGEDDDNMLRDSVLDAYKNAEKDLIFRYKAYSKFYAIVISNEKTNERFLFIDRNCDGRYEERYLVDKSLQVKSPECLK